MSVNKVFLLGRVGKDPDIRDVSGTKVATFTLATTDRSYTKQDGTVISERTEWHNIVVWRKLAEIVERYIVKGTKLHISGSIHTRSYNDSNGNKRYVTEIMANDLELLGSPQQQAQQQAAPTPAPTYTKPQQGYIPQQQAQQTYQQPQQQTQQGYMPQQGYTPTVADLPY